MKKSKEDKFTESEFKLFKDFFLNKRKRKDLKMEFLKAQKYVLENADFTKKPVTKEEYDERALNVLRLENSVGGLYVIKEAEKTDKELRMINCRFKLYKKGKAYIIANTFDTPNAKKKTDKTFHFMPNGLPIKTAKKEYKYRNKFEFSDYELIDEGIFKQVFDEIKGSKVSYKGKIYNFRIKYHQISSDKKTHMKTYRIKMLRFEKRILPIPNPTNISIN